MSVSAVSHSMNASYPKYLENKRRTGAYITMASGTLGTSVAALHFLKTPFAQRNPWLLATGAALSLLGGIIGVSQMSSASKEIKKHSEQVAGATNLEYTPEKDTVALAKADDKDERAKRYMNHLIMSNPVYNPFGANIHALNPTIDATPLDSPIAKQMCR